MKRRKQQRKGWLVLLYLLLAFLLPACAATMEELVAEATETGDWSKVEARENIKRKIESLEESSARCRAGGGYFMCDGPTTGPRVKHTNCGCVSEYEMRRVLGPFQP